MPIELLSKDALGELVIAYGVSQAELETLHLALSGHTADAISEQLEVSAVSVRKRLGSIYQKFEISGNVPGKLEILRNILKKLQEPQQSDGAHDWGEAPSVQAFYGRTSELLKLSTWSTKDQCKLIVILGMGGIGKTTLATKLARQLSRDFKYIIWRSLREAPPVKTTLDALLKFINDQQSFEPSDNVSEKITQLISLLKQKKCLIVLDNIESILKAGASAGEYQADYEEYGTLFKRISEAEHQSCIVLTSREKPKYVATVESEISRSRSLTLTGLRQFSEEILNENRLTGEAKEKLQLISLYDGNPLALKIVSTLINELFNGSISHFLNQGNLEIQNSIVFSDIRDLLDEQFERLSSREKITMYWLAINREAVHLSELQTDLVPFSSISHLLESVQYLGRRSLIEKDTEGRFTLQNAVMEYMTAKLVELVCEEISEDRFYLFDKCALIKATSKDYIREAQNRLILQPISEKLRFLISGVSYDIWASRILSKLRSDTSNTLGYSSGNLLNLLCSLQVPLHRYDFSSLTIRQAYLQGVTLHNVDCSNSTFYKSVFTETFGGVLSVAYSSDGKSLAIGDTSGEIRIWSNPDYQQLIALQGHDSWVWSIAFGCHGRLLASGSEDQTVRIWDLHTGQCLKVLSQHNSRVRTVAFSSDEKLLASGSEDQTVRIWDLHTGQCLKVLKGHTDWIRAISFNPKNSTQLASAGNDGTIKIWDIEKGNCVHSFRGHTNWVWSIDFSPNGQLLASSSEDKTIKIWKVDSKECVSTFIEHTERVRAVLFISSDQVVSGSDDRTLKLWDLETNQCLRSFQGHDNCIRSITCTPDGRTLASGSEDETVRIWNVGTGTCSKNFQGYMSGIRAIAFSPDGKSLASGNCDHTVRLWNIKKSNCYRKIRGHNNWVWSVAFSPDGKLLASASSDHTVKIWDVYTGDCLRNFPGHGNWVWSVAFSPDGKTLASGSEDLTIRLWDIQTGEWSQLQKGHTNKVRKVTFSPDGQFLASCSDDQTVKVWNILQKKCLATLKGHNNWVRSVAFSPDSKLIASGSEDKTIRIWNVETKECLSVLEGHKNGIWSVAISPKGNLVVSGSDDCTVKLWDIKSGECLKTFDDHHCRVQTVAFSPDGKFVAGGSEDEKILIWNVDTREETSRIKSPRPYEAMKISGVKGLTPAQIKNLKALGAEDGLNDFGRQLL